MKSFTYPGGDFQHYLKKCAVVLLAIFLFGSTSILAQTYYPDNPYLTNLDAKQIGNWLKNAPLETDAAAKSKMIVINLPLPGGGTMAMRTLESPVIDAESSALHPDIKTYAMQEVDGTATGRLMVSGRGIDGVILLDDGAMIYIEPVTLGEKQHKVYYSTGEFPHGDDTRYYDGYEHQHGKGGTLHGHGGLKSMTYNIGATRRDFRMHVVADVEYSVAVCGVGPTRPCVEAAITAAVNAMNALYNRDMCTQLTLNLPNQTIYLVTNPAAFAPGGGAMDPPWLSESQTIHMQLEGGPVNGQPQVLLNSYDVGHLFSGRVGMGSGGGGVAFVGVVCNDNIQGPGRLKAGGGSGVPNPQGASWVELLAHEFTHQFNADHTWNGTDGFCTSGQWSTNGVEAYEPGSGSTIVSYSGICNTHNIPNPGNTGYYHTSSINAVNDFINGPATCETTTATGNTPPVPSVSTGGCTPNFNIPTQTPFCISGSATDANDPVGNLTYTWEQFDLGTYSNPILAPTSPPVPADAPPNTAPGTYNGEPLFRSFFPSSSASRIFPQMSTILSGQYNGDQTAAALTLANWQGELLSEVARTITLRLTVRDNNAACGGVEHADAAINVVNTGAPFKVTSPDLGNPTLTQGTTETITWNVAGTTAAPISCANVNIRISTDGGMTYPHDLGSFPNTGTASVCIPQSIPASTTARLQVRCGNDCFYFFDISNANFTVATGPACGAMCSITATASATDETCAGGNDGTINVNAMATGCSGTLEYSLNGGPFQAGNTFMGLAPGAYTATVRCSNDPSCTTTAMATVNAGMGACPPTPTISQTDADGDGNPEIIDPCSCGDPMNLVDGMGQVTYFHDFFQVSMTGPGETWQITAGSGLFDNSGMPLTLPATLTETSPGVYFIDVWHQPGSGMSGVVISRTGGGAPFSFPPQANSCTACAQVPTIGQWGLIILSILILTFGVVALRTRQTVLAGTNTTSSAFSIRQLPFDKKSFGKMLAFVMLGLAAVFTVSVAFFGYEMTSADVPGSLVAGPLLAYMLHLLHNKK